MTQIQKRIVSVETICKNTVLWTQSRPKNAADYSIVKDSNADLTVGNWNSKKDP